MHTRIMNHPEAQLAYLSSGKQQGLKGKLHGIHLKEAHGKKLKDLFLRDGMKGTLSSCMLTSF